ncbi:MAG: Mth938-like domain-containing protein [Gammaproteobacteria bacterium]
MQFIKDNTENARLITGIDSGAIRVDEDVITSSFILNADTVVTWPVSHVNQIESDHWQAVLDTQPEIILLGTGPTLIFPEPHQLKAAYDRQIGVEVMDTEAACRTYNLLVHERRKVTAALII